MYVGAMINIEDKTLFATWYEMLKEYSFEQVKNAIIKRTSQSSYPANIPEIILKNIPKSFKNAITIKNQSRSYMKNMLENAILRFLHTGEKQKQD